MSLLNRKFGPYVLLKKLAVGGMAELFLALKLGPGAYEKFVVLKTILAHHNDNPDYVKLFYEEGAIGGLLSHPNVVTTHDVDVIDGTHVMVMEFMRGVTVAEMAERGAELNLPLPQEFAIQLLIDACEGLHYAHNLNNAAGEPYELVHRDISPQNVFVTFDGLAKVFDFGIAQTRRPPGEEDPHKGMLAGKYAYMSPEQARAQEVDRRSDVFSLGIILYELTTGKRLFKRENELHAIKAITSEAIPSPSDVLDRYPRFLERIVLKALARDRDERYEDALSLADDLRKFLKISGAKPTAHKLSEYVTRLFHEEIKDTEAFTLQARGLVEEAHGRADPMEAAKTSALEAQIAAAKASRSAQERMKRLEAEAQAAEPPPSSSPNVHVPERPTGPQRLAQVEIAPDNPSRPSKKGNTAIVVVLIVVILGLVGALVFMLSSQKRDGEDPQQGGAATEEPPSTSGKIRVSSRPLGAEVFFNGQSMNAKTPTTLDAPFGQDIDVEVRLEGYTPFTKTVRLDKDAPLWNVDATLNEKSEEPAEDEVKTGNIKITSAPEGATLYLDGKEVGKTPATISDVEVGNEVILIITAEDHKSLILPLEVTEGEIQVDEILEKPKRVTPLSIDSFPTSARVTLNEQFIGLTPLPTLLVEPDTYNLVISRGDLLYERELKIKKDEPVTVKASFDEADSGDMGTDEPPAIATISSTPSTSIIVKGLAIGTTPVEKAEVPPGTHIVEFIDYAEGIKHSEVVTFNSGQELELNFEIPLGKLSITSTPPARVFINNKEKGETPVKDLEMYVGEKLIRLEAEGHKTFEKKVAIDAGRTTELEPELEPKDGEAPPE